MSLPSMTMVPSFFSEIEAEPHFSRIESPASTTAFLPILTLPSSATLIPAPLPTLSASAPPTFVASSAATLVLRPAPISTDEAAATFMLCAAPMVTLWFAPIGPAVGGADVVALRQPDRDLAHCADGVDLRRADRAGLGGADLCRRAPRRR